MSNSTKIRPLGADVFHSDSEIDRLRDTIKLVVAFHNFAKTLKNVQHTSRCNGNKSPEDK